MTGGPVNRVCIRGCMIRDVHYATCPDYSTAPEDATCRGCAPRECRDGSYWCDKCFGRARALLNDVTDLHGRLTALVDPLKASAIDQVRVAASTEPPAPVSADMLDALIAVTAATDWAYVDLADCSNDLDRATYLSALLLDRHPEVDGVRQAWSVQDAVDRWGIERRDTFVYPTADEDDIEIGPVQEWYDPLLTVQQAAQRAGVDQRRVRRWVKSGVLPVVARSRGPRGSVLTFVYASAVDQAAEKAHAREVATRYA